jgi:predicted amidohydrolase
MIQVAMKAGFFQFNPIFGEKEKNIAKVVDTLKGADADLMVLPEFFATGYQFISMDEVAHLAEEIPGGETTEALASLSRKHGIYIVGGLPERDGERFYNSAIITGPEGFIGVYRKTHLFFEEKLWFKPGDTGFKVFHTDVGVMGIMICFDWYFPESVRALALQGAQVIAHPANLVLPHCPAAMPIRCLENRVYAVTANRTGSEQRKEGVPLTFIGMSQIVAPDSTVIARAPENGDSTMVEDIDLEKAFNKAINPYNDLFQDRRPEMYQILVRTEDL